MIGLNDNHKRQHLLKKLNFSGVGEGLPEPRNKVSYPSHPSIPHNHRLLLVQKNLTSIIMKNNNKKNPTSIKTFYKKQNQTLSVVGITFFQSHEIEENSDMGLLWPPLCPVLSFIRVFVQST